MRTFAGITAAALAAGLLTAPSAEADKITWNHSIWGNPRSFTVGIETMAEFLKEKTDGNFEIVIHYGETISPARENLDTVSLRAADSAHLCASYHPGKNPVSTVLDLPFLPIDDVDHLSRVHEAYAATEHHKAEMARWNVRFMVSGTNPLFEVMGRGQAPGSLDDWKGMRIRALGGLGSAFRKLGAVPTTVPAPEVYTSIERGVVRAVSFPFAYPFGAYRVYEVSDWYTVGMNLGVPWCFAVMNEASYEELPEEYKQLLEEGKKPFYEAQHADFQASEKHWVAIFDERLKRIEYSQEQLEELKRIAAVPVWEEWVEEMKGRIPSQELLDTVLEIADETRQGS